MPLSKQEAVEQGRIMLGWRAEERGRLERIRTYMRGEQRFCWLPANPPREVRRIADMARVNVLKLVADSVAQSMYVDGYRSPDQESENPAWEIWQRNRLDARQLGIHRAAQAYGASYAVVLPGDPAPVIRGVSPRDMTVVYGEDLDWPIWALEKRRSAVKTRTLFRLYDDTAAYYLETDGSGRVEYISTEEHGAGVCPVVRFLAEDDIDGDVIGKVEPLLRIQDQIDFTTFGLLVVQHYGAFPQKWIAGWLPTEDEKVAVGAGKVVASEDPETKFGSWPAASLDGYISSRRDALKNFAAIAQMSENALRGELVNLSAEALEAAKDQERRKLSEALALAGESWEQTLELAAHIDGKPVDSQAQVRWRDTETRSFSAVVDALSKLKDIGVPVELILERVPGMTQQDVERAKALAAQGDSFAQLAALLDRQASNLPEF